MGRIDRSKAKIVEKGFRFAPFRPTAKHEMALRDMGYKSDRSLLAFERGGERRAVNLQDATYHHVVQGTLAGEPYLVTF